MRVLSALHLNDLHFANSLVQSWQSIANAMAKFCHPIGKVLPTCWQGLAKALAKQWQLTDKILAFSMGKTWLTCL
ncbi:MAG: hypothetical protein LUF04_00845 [Bacteroides sp.]|nr:hypothetical protein [Bacteroides sp.]